MKIFYHEFFLTNISNHEFFPNYSMPHGQAILDVTLLMKSGSNKHAYIVLGQYWPVQTADHLKNNGWWELFFSDPFVTTNVEMACLAHTLRVLFIVMLVNVTTYRQLIFTTVDRSFPRMFSKDLYIFILFIVIFWSGYCYLI